MLAYMITDLYFGVWIRRPISYNPTLCRTTIQAHAVSSQHYPKMENYFTK